MTGPTPSDLHTDQALTNLSVAYIQSESNFIAHRVFPTVPVDFQSDLYYTFPLDTFLRSRARKRAPATESAGANYTVSSDTYRCDEWGLHKDVTPQERANADRPALDPDRSATRFVTHGMLITREEAWLDAYFKDSVWGTTVTGGADFVAWDDQANSDPIKDVKDAIRIVGGSTGFEPNTMIVQKAVHDALTQHPMILERVKYTGGEVTETLLARLFEVRRYMVTKAVKATSPEGTAPASQTAAYMAGKHALLAHVADTPAIDTPSAGYSFAWSGLTGVNDIGVRIVRLPMDHLGVGTERIEGSFAFDFKKVSAPLGYFFSGAVA